MVVAADTHSRAVAVEHEPAQRLAEVVRIFLGALAVARLAVRSASDAETLARVQEARAARAAEPAPAAPPYAEPKYVPRAQEQSDVSSGALTKPRIDGYGSSEADPKRGWRRNRPPAGPSDAADLRWPHPQG